jgi:trk system potassium uptake protein TrkA
MGVPRDATIVAIVRDRHVIVPRGETMMQAGDEVLVLVTPETEEAVKTLLVGSGASTITAASGLIETTTEIPS